MIFIVISPPASREEKSQREAAFIMKHIWTVQ